MKSPVAAIRITAFIFGVGLLSVSAFTVGMMAQQLDERRWLIIDAAAFAMIEAVLIIALLLRWRRRAEIRLRDSLRGSEERIDMAIKAAGLGLWDWDRVRDRIWATEKCRNLHGITSNRTLNYRAFLKNLHPDDREPTHQAFQRALAQKTEYRCEYRVIRSDGGIRWITSQGRGCCDGAEKPLRLMGVSIDVTDSKQAGVELQNQRQALAHLARVAMLGELSAALAHELNQPLTAILSNAQAATRLLEQFPPDWEEIRAILHDIVEDDRRAGEVVHRLWALFKKEDTARQAVDVNAVIRDVGKMMYSDLAAKQVSPSLDLAVELPKVKGDPVQLQQVLINLLLNGSEAMASMSPDERRLQVCSRKQEPATLEVTVRDNGTGIDPERLEQIFEPFFTSKNQGLGMGLAISRSIAAAHGGRLWASNHPDGGALFQFELPISTELNP
ncbi:MAG: ATP-binding protein [Methylococcaceae bacterium]|nr:ATP-binding protein [Methylococcaceae bacterium]